MYEALFVEVKLILPHEVGTTLQTNKLRNRKSYGKLEN